MPARLTLAYVTPALLISACVLMFTFASPGVARAEAVSRLASFQDWSLYTDEKSPHLFCFLTSEPKSSDPADTPREPPRIYITAWPKEGVKAEPSIRLGFPAKKGSDISVAINNASFKLFAADERAYVQDATQELKLIDAMKKGNKLAVTATTATGTSITDTYSLTGLGQAVQELHSTCF